jgi:bifunctional DNase/RNase
MEEPIEVELSRMVLHHRGDQQLVYLRAREDGRTFRIVIGVFEAAEIQRKVLGGPKHPRPMTHDLIGRILTATGARLLRVVINDLRDDTFYAELHVQQGSEEKVVDCRPSDGIALATQLKAKIFVAPHVLDAVSSE